jgi:hypothetical protein
MLLALPAAVAAQPIQKHSTNAVWFENWIGLSQAMMRVATPDGDIRDVVSANGTPVYELKGSVEDGTYRYELRAATDEMVKNKDYDENGIIGNDAEYIPKSLYITGSFIVVGGVITRPEDIEEETEG